MTTSKCDIIVVGAGISGLTAAYRLKKRDPNLHVVVLESKDRVGGRTQTVPMKAASGIDNWDLGGQWVGRCQPHIMSLLDELNIGTYPQFLQGTKVMQLGGHSISTYKSDIPSLSLLSLIDLQLFILRCGKLHQEVQSEDPWKSKNGVLWDSMTLDTFLRNNLWTKGAREAVESAGRCMFGAEATQMSVLFYLTYVTSAGGIKNLVEATEGTAQEYKINGGAQQVSTKMAETVGSSNIHLSEPVESIDQTDSDVIVKTRSGDIYECKRVICAVPPPGLAQINFLPSLPPVKQELIRRMPIGSMMKIIITYRKMFWRESGYSGEVVSNGGPPLVESCDSGPLCIVYDATSPIGNPALVAFIGAKQAVQFAAISKTDRQSCVLNQLVTYFGQEVLDFLEYREKDWNSETYTNGGPVCCVGTGAMQYYAELRQPVDRIHFAGTETATEWCGYMSGAVQSGHRAAVEVLSHIRPDLVSEDDLDLFTSRTRQNRSRSSAPWMKISIGLGVCVLLGAVLSRKIHLSDLITQRR